MKNKPIVAIIQARMGSSRLPGKVLKKVGENTILEVLIKRLKKCKHLDDIIVATSQNEVDNKIIDFLEKKGIKCFRGSEDNVLDRYIKAAEKFNAQIIVRVTGDNPLTDPVLIDKLIESHLECISDYSYCKDLPLGISAEVVNFSTLNRISHNHLSNSDKEHVTLYIRSNPDKFHVNQIFSKFNHENIRLTVDNEEDLKLLRLINEHLGPIENIKTEDILKLYLQNPEIFYINSHIKQENPEKSHLEPKITVIIRTHNSEKYVKRAINSVLNQTAPNDLYEIIVIDDGSQDKTKEILFKFSNYIRFIEKNKLGAVKSANLGISYSNTEYFVLLDSDDEFEPEAIEEYLKIIECFDPDFILCDYYEKYVENNEFKTISLKNNVFNSVAGGIVFKKSVFNKVGPYNEKIIFPEYELLFNLINQNFNCEYINKPLFTYYRHNSSMTANKDFIKKGLEELGQHKNIEFSRILKDLER